MRTRRLGRMPAALIACCLFGLSCTDAFIEPRSIEEAQVDDRLALTGRVCTDPPNPNGFPVKVVFVIDQSGSMCVSDPPGSQESSGFCQRAELQAIIPPGVTEPARVRALRRLIDQLSAQPNVFVSVVPFETNVKNVWPPAASGDRFARPNSTLETYVSGLQAQLGKGTDYQGALAYTYGLIASDITETSANNPELLPRTRYVVVFLTDGTPYPRCSANDDLTTYAGPANPDLTWADSSSAVEFCNLLDADERENIFGVPGQGDDILGYTPGTDRNQNYQLFSYVDQLMDLKRQFNVGDVRLHTVLLFNEAAVAACGPICQDIYGAYEGVAPAQYPQAAKQIAAWTLQSVAQRGNGIFQEFRDGDIQNLSLGALDYSSLASPNVMKTLMLQSLRSLPTPNGRVVDSDGDGLPDTVDNGFSHGTNPYFADSDEDCFDDTFEIRRGDEGFIAGNDKDTRGCDPQSPLSLDCRCADTDGDLLSQYAEAFLKTRTGLVDSDADGIPDGLEARHGLDPLTAYGSGLDTDGDGISDLDELRAGSDPTRQDRAFFDRHGYQYEVTSETMDDGRVCYDFTVSNIQLVTPPSAAGGRQGYNLFKLWFAQAPASGVATDYGVWSAACGWAQFDPPSIRNPAGVELSMQPSAFAEPFRFIDREDFLGGSCVGTSP